MACYCKNQKAASNSKEKSKGPCKKKPSLKIKQYFMKEKSVSFDNNEFGRVIVQLYKRTNETLGLRVSGGADRGEVPVIASIQPGSVADMHDCLLVGDQILSINGLNTARMKHEEIINLVKAATACVTLEIQYRLPHYNDQRSSSGECSFRKCNVTLQKGTEERFGFVIRGGRGASTELTRRITVMSVREGSIAQRNGQIKPGDYILSINGHCTENLSCEEAMNIIRGVQDEILLFLEYSVANQDMSVLSNGLFAVEIQKAPSECLGISLKRIENDLDPFHFAVDGILEGSIADRCGALRVGDKLLSINGRNAEEFSLKEAVMMLNECGSEILHLEMCPAKIRLADQWPSISYLPRAKSMPTGVSTLHCIPESEQDDALHLTTQSRPLAPPYTLRQNIDKCFTSPRKMCPLLSSLNYNHCPQTRCSSVLNEIIRPTNLYQHHHTKSTISLVNATSIQRSEECLVRLTSQDRQSYGFTLTPACEGGERVLLHWPLIQDIQMGGPAYRSGLMQIGDRIVSINGRSTIGTTLDQLKQLFRTQAQLNAVLTLNIHFDIADTIIPTVGEFQVKLPKVCGTLGINLQSLHSRRLGEPIIISKVVSGGVTHRSGSIAAGDLLLAIDGVSVTCCSLEETVQRLQNRAASFVSLTVRKCPPILTNMRSHSYRNAGMANILRVQLFRDQPDHVWGISLNDGPVENELLSNEIEVFIETVLPGSLADRCGLLNEGDVLLAINEQMLSGHSVEEATDMLQQFPDRVSLKVKKKSTDTDLETGLLPPGLNGNLLNGHLLVRPQSKNPSCDSAVDLPDNANTDSDSGDCSNTTTGNAQSYYQPLLLRTSSSTFTCLPPPSKMLLENHEKCVNVNRDSICPPRYLRPTSLVVLDDVPPTTASQKSMQTGGLLASVRIIKSSDIHSFGLALSETIDRLTGSHNVFVSGLMKSSPAETSRHIQLGDAILQVNNQSTDGLSIDEVANLIASSGNVLDLVLRKCNTLHSPQ